VTAARVVDLGLHASGNLRVSSDARLDNPRLIWSETRLINRASTAHTGSVSLDRLPEVDVRDEAHERADTTVPIVVDLPLDVRFGDLRLIPSHSLLVPPLLATWLSGLE
jgi:hypothetical protein